jgi:hypothetical protein
MKMLLSVLLSDLHDTTAYLSRLGMYPASYMLAKHDAEWCRQNLMQGVR